MHTSTQTIQATQIGPVIPYGMTEVTHSEFWKAVMSETRDVMPSPRRDQSDWMLVGTGQRWGWVSSGFVTPEGAVTHYALASAGGAA